MALIEFTTSTGLNLYAVVRDAATVWNQLTPGFEAYNAANWTSTKYAIAMSETGASGYYSVTFPASIPDGTDVTIDVRLRAGGSPSPSDTSIGFGTYRFTGSLLITSANVTLWAGKYVEVTVNDRPKVEPSGGTVEFVDDLATDAKQSVANAVWNETQASHVTAGTFGLYLDATVSSINTKLGTPAGASVSADIAAVKTDTASLVSRIGATLFSGITSLAQWLGLIAGKQTGNSTARTEIRATGAGSGTFNETTDSLEAVRDRGDAAWVDTSSSDIAAAVAQRLGSVANVTVIGIVNGDTIDMVKGDQYTLADGREWRFTKIAGEPWPADLTDHTITLTATKCAGNFNSGDATGTINGTISTATGDSQSVYFEPTESFTDSLAVGTGTKGYHFDVVAIKDGVKKTLRLGLMTVRSNQTAVP